MRKKRIVIWAAVFMAFLLPGCGTELTGSMGSAPAPESGQTSSDQGVVEHTLALPYDSKDSLNPFEAKTVANTALIPVMYDGLIRINEKFEAEPAAAKEVKCAGLQVTVTLRDGLLFSDGSKVTAADVIYSFEKAKASARYQAQLAGFISAQAQKKAPNIVIFTLQAADPLCENLLDFPIVKKDSPEDGLPIGCGRYIGIVEESTAKLVYNQKHFRGNVPEQLEIPLKSMPDHEAMLSAIKTGGMSAVFSDLSSGELSSAGALSKPVTMNNLVYIGYHSARPYLDQPAFRQAISYAIDKSTLFYNAFSGRGSLANFPIHPLVSAGMELPTDLLLSHSLEKANALLDGAGYQEKNAEGWRVVNGQPITLELLVNADSNAKKLAGSLVKEMLAAAGIQITLRQESFAAYQASVTAGNYDLYIGEMKLLNNMSLSPLLQSEAYLAGIRSEQLLASYQAYLDGTGQYADFIRQFNAELPFTPLLFRSGILIYNRNIQSEVISSVSDVYYNLEDWS